MRQDADTGPIHTFRFLSLNPVSCPTGLTTNRQLLLNIVKMDDFIQTASVSEGYISRAGRFPREFKERTSVEEACLRRNETRPDRNAPHVRIPGQRRGT